MPSEPHDLRTVTGQLTWRNRLDHFLARWRVNRSGHRVEPGLYALGNPGPEAPVFVTANYTLSFDALRSALSGRDAYILVLETYGINVWCAAAKGTFSTEELTRRIETSRLADIVTHRTLILPQLGAAGVAAHLVKKRSGFRIEYGPVRAADLPEYLRTGRATEAMRRVRFGLLDRLILVPVELVGVFLPMLLAAAALYLIGGWLSAGATVAAVLAGVVLFPALLPWLPTRDFSSKGFILGGLVALPFAAAVLWRNAGADWWRLAGAALSYLLAMPPATAYLALNFTGATPLASPSGVRREIFTYIRPMAWSLGSGLLLTILLAVVRLLRG